MKAPQSDTLQDWSDPSPRNVIRNILKNHAQAQWDWRKKKGYTTHMSYEATQESVEALADLFMAETEEIVGNKTYILHLTGNKFMKEYGANELRKEILDKARRKYESMDD